MGFPIHHPEFELYTCAYAAESALRCICKWRGVRDSESSTLTAPPNHLDASVNAMVVDTVRSIDASTKRGAVENGIKVAVESVIKVGTQGMTSTACGLTTRRMVTLTNTSTASASLILTNPAKWCRNLVSLVRIQ
jgi:hypothetical protein